MERTEQAIPESGSRLERQDSAVTQPADMQTRKRNLRQQFHRHLKKTGFRKNGGGELEINGSGKDAIRSLFHRQRAERFVQNRRFMEKHYEALSAHFASGADVDPSRISPVLQRIRAGTEESRLFRLATLTWSAPVSRGFGRRIRYLVRDQHNGKLIGLFAIGDPVFNLQARDKEIGWNAGDRRERLVNIMNAYVLGAVPPYNMLLGGKLVACMVRSRDVYEDFQKMYGNRKGLISKANKNPRLLAVMTTSALGRSSIYNRLKLDGVQYFRPIGYTGGWGSFHVPDQLFLKMRELLRQTGHPYADQHRFGEGPSWRLRTIRAALGALGIKGDPLKHTIQREVFLSELATNAVDMLRSGEGQPDLKTLLSAREVAALALERWVIPRAVRRPGFARWTLGDFEKLFFGNHRQRRQRLNGQPKVQLSAMRRPSPGTGWGRLQRPQTGDAFPEYGTPGLQREAPKEQAA